MSSFIAHPLTPLSGHYKPPGDKSISHRAIILGALASGRSQFHNFLNADDCQRTIEAFRLMGVDIKQSGTEVTVTGVGLRGLKSPGENLYLGNSGTAMRLLLGVLASQPFQAQLTGDVSLSKRPMKRVTEPLMMMGASISGADDANFAPLRIQGGKLKGIRFQNRYSSAQVKSALLLAGLGATGETVVEEPIASRDHTEWMLKMMGANLLCKDGHISLRGGQSLSSIEYQIPGDISSAAFWIVAAAISDNAHITIEDVGLNSTRIGFLEVLKSMEACIDWKVKKTGEGEPVGSIEVKSSKLRAAVIDKTMIPRLIDELPILMVACACAEGTTTIRDAKELRVKETDRIHSMVKGLKAIGGDAEEREDGCLIRGVTHFQGGQVESFGDHRTAMSFVVAALRSKSPIQVDDVSCVETSYPQFFDHWKAFF